MSTPGPHELFTHSPAAILKLRGPAHLVELANDRARGLLGNRSLVGATLGDALPELSGQPMLALLDSVYETGEPLRARGLPVRLDRRGLGTVEPCHLDLVSEPTHDAQGRVNGMWLHALDLTEQVTARQRTAQLTFALGQARAHTQHAQRVTELLANARSAPQVVDAIVREGVAALGALAGTIALLDADGAHLTLAGQLGYPEALAARWRRLPAETSHPLCDAVRQREPIVLTRHDAYAARHPELPPGLQQAAWLIVPLLVDGQAIGALALHLATADELDEPARAFVQTLAQQCAQGLVRAQLCELELRLRAEAQRALRTRDELLRTLSHELRTPVGIMSLWTEVLRDAPDAATRTRALGVIHDALLSQSRMIDELVDASRLAAGKVELSLLPTELAPLLETSLASVRPCAGAREIAVAFASDGSAPRVLADAARLQQLFGNLLANAISASPEGGRVTVHLLARAGEAEVSIHDDGEGIAAEALPHLFEAFGAGDCVRSQTGLGLGLSVVAELARLHDGSVEAHSEGLQRGVTFVVRLPVLAALETDAPESVAGDEREQLLLGLELLIVDDQPEARDGLALLLGRAGAAVTVAASASEALAELERGAPDLLLSDLAMPNQNGFELIRTIRARTDAKRRLPAVAFSAHATPEDRDRALKAGFDFHLAKTVGIRELVQELSRLARTRGEGIA